MKTLPLPKSCLLLETWEFKRVYEHGRRLRGRGFSIIHTPSDKTANRLGISIHRKIKGAVRRNRIKRIIREFYRLHRDFLPPAHDIVFTVRPDFEADSPAEVERAVQQVLQSRKKTVPATG